jgi:ubiquinone/menaquinone biosynthesis C-methylase UbiE
MPNFEVTDWKEQFHKSSASDWKEIFYFFLRPLFHWQHKKLLLPKTLQSIAPNLVLGERGFPLKTRKKWAVQGNSLEGKTILVQGTGTGWDLYSWALFKPKKIIGVDLFEFDCWPEIQKEINEEFGIEVEFHTAPLDDLSFLKDESIDICASDAVLEHVQNLKEVFQETHRILKPEGVVYATYGPMWFCPGGDHFCGRGGLETVYNHILKPHEEYMEYFQSQKNDVENFQSGGRYVELDLFSKLKTEEYLQIFKESDFKVNSLILEISREAIEFQKKFPAKFEQLLKKYPSCNKDDFLIKANFIKLIKN